MKSFFATLVLLAPMLSFGLQTKSEAVSFSDLDEVEPRVTGYLDANGLKQGYFIIYGKDAPDKGYPSEGKIEEGNYKDDRKIGEWIMYHVDGITPRLKGNFVDGRPNGDYVKINQQGVVVEKGTSNNKKQTGIFIVYHDNGTPKIQKTFNADGKENGDIKFFYDNGQPQYVGKSVNGIPTGEGIKYWEDGSVKEIVTYGQTGEVVSTKVVNAEPPVAKEVESGTGGPSGLNGTIKDGNKFQTDGYNKVYNRADELWMDGQFKKGNFWEGKLYKYDSDGILLRIEIWKNGAYHSDGQL